MALISPFTFIPCASTINLTIVEISINNTGNNAVSVLMKNPGVSSILKFTFLPKDEMSPSRVNAVGVIFFANFVTKHILPSLTYERR